MYACVCIILFKSSSSCASTLLDVIVRTLHSSKSKPTKHAPSPDKARPTSGKSAPAPPKGSYHSQPKPSNSKAGSAKGW